MTREKLANVHYYASLDLLSPHTLTKYYMNI